MKRGMVVAFVLLVAVFITSSLIVFGQGAAPAPAAAARTVAPAAPGELAPKKAEQWSTLWEMWGVGGPCMWPLGACSVLALGLSVYGFIFISETKMLRPELVGPLQEALGKMDIEGALTICNGTPCTLTNIMGAGLRRISDGVLDVSSMEKAMEEASVEETNEGLKPLNNLSVCTVVAPMLGLLGTITGMIGAFNKIGMGSMGDPEKLANDIGEAMITTAFGLMIAIPAMFAYFYLKAKYTANLTRLSRLLGNMLHILVTASRRAEQGGQPAEAPAGADAAGGEQK